MKLIDAADLDYKDLNKKIRQSDEDCTIDRCCGQRFIGTGISGKTLTINGIPGNALGAYLNDALITVNANAQDVVGDTMNEGKILIHGNVGNFPCTILSNPFTVITPDSNNPYKQMYVAN